MPYFAVTRERGPAWDAERPMREQPSWDAHAAFMDELAHEGLVVLGGPLGGGEDEFLLIFDAETEDAIRARLDDDPWTGTQHLRIARIVPWEILLRGPGA